MLSKNGAADNKSASAFLLDINDLVVSIYKSKGEKQFETEVHNILHDYLKCYKLTQNNKFDSYKEINNDAHSSATSLNSQNQVFNQMPLPDSSNSVQDTNNERNYNYVYLIFGGVVILIAIALILVIIFKNNPGKTDNGRNLLGVNGNEVNNMNLVGDTSKSNAYGLLGLVNNILII